jgi:signal peptidase I
LLEPYTYGKVSEPLASQFKGLNITFPYTVPMGELWVMGDNRTNSADSRYFGPIDAKEVIGRAFVVYFPFEDFGLIG